MADLRLSREDVELAFADLGRAARAAERVIDLAVYGGVAMMLTFPARPATRDVDAVARGDAAFLREAVRRVAQARGWTDHWLNDAVKGFLSEQDARSLTLFGSYPSEAEAGLRVYVARPEYLLAMKCIAMRIDQSSAAQDRDDIKMLVERLGLTTPGQVLDIVGHFYPANRIPPKTQFGVEEIMEQLNRGA